MKLHLPIALLAAVLSAVAYGGEPYDKNNFTQEGDNKYVYSNSETGVTYSYETAADGTISSTVTGEASSTKFYDFGTWTGTVVNVPYTDADWSASNTILNIGDSQGTSTSVDTVIGAGVRGTEVLGNKTTNIHSGAEVGMAIAGYITWNNKTYPAYQPYEQPYYNNWGASDSDQDTTISLNISGKVSQGVYGHYIGAQGIANAMNPTYGGDPSFALKEAIDITVDGGQVNAMILAGGFNSRVDNAVSVTVNEGSQTMSIYGGVQNANGNPGYVKSTHITVNGGTVNGSVYGGGRYSTDYPQGYSLVKEGTLVEINGGTVTGDVYGAGKKDTVIGGTRVLVNGKADIQGHIYGGGLDGLSTVEGDRVITFDNHGEVDWTKVHDFDAVEFTGTTTTKLGTDGQLAENYKKVTIDNSYITGSIGHAVELDVTNNIHVALDGDLTTKAYSEIVDNKNAIQIKGDATFNGTKIENSTIEAGGDISLESGSKVTKANLTTGGMVAFNNSSMQGGKITVGPDNEYGKPAIDIWEGSNVSVDSIKSVNGELVSVSVANSSSLVVDGGLELGQSYIKADSSVTADHITAENGIVVLNSQLTATEGDINLKGAQITESDKTKGATSLSAKNGSVKLTDSTMDGGDIVAGEGIELRNSDVTADSLNEGADLELTGTQGSKLTVNNDVKLNNAKLFNNSGLTADSVNVSGSAYVQDSSITAENGNIELESSYVLDGSLKAEKGDVVLNNTSVNGGSIVVGGALHLAGSNVDEALLNNGGAIKVTTADVEGRYNQLVVKGDLSLAADSNFIGTADKMDNTLIKADSITAEDTKVDYTKVTATKDDISFGAGSEITNSSLTATKGDVVLSGTTMSDTTVTTNGKFDIREGSKVTMDSLTGLNNIHISDSSLSTEKLVVNKGETFKVTGDGVDRTGDKLILSGTGVALEEAFVVNGEATIEDATLVITGSNSQLGIAYGANGGKLVIDGSNVDMHEASTLHMGYNAGEAGELIITNGSNFLSASNNAWLGGGKVEVSNGSTLDVCNSENSYNYRTIMGWEGHTLDVDVKGASTFNSAATQLITNYHSGTTVDILVDGQGSSFNHAGTIESNSSYAIGATGEWVEKDGKWYDKGTLGLVGSGKGTTHTLTYLLDAGTDEYGAKKAAVNNVSTTITAQNGGSVNIDSAITYVGGFQDVATFGNELKKQLNLNVGEGSSMSFNRMEVYANTNVANDGSFEATDINVHDGATFNYAGSGTLTANSLGVANGGEMNLGSDNVGSKVVLNVAGSGQSGVISGELNVTNTKLEVIGSSSSQFWIDGGTMTVDKGSTVDLSVGTTLRVGNENAGVLNVQGGSTLKGGANNLWVYDNSTINVSGAGSVMGVCNDTDHYNYRVLMGITNHNGAQGSAEQTINVTDGGKFTSSATQFVTNFHSNTTTKIEVSGENSLFQQTGKTDNKNHYVVGTTGEWVEVNGKWLDKGSTGDGKYVAGQGDTITYLLSNGTDKDGVLGYPVENAKVYISAKDGGTVQFDSALTYVGNVGVSDAYIKANENNKAIFTVGDKASMSFKQMELYANTVINFEKPVSGDFTSGSIGDLNTDKYTTGGSFSADKITVHAGTQLDVKGNGTDSGSQFILTGTGKSNDEALVVDGTMNVNNANLVMKGTNSQLGIGYGADRAVMNVTNSTVDLSEGTTLHIGYNANTSNSVLNITSSKFVGGSNNAWLGGGTINVTKNSTLSVCTGDEDHYNYRVLMGLKGNTVNLNVESGSKFESSASQFVTNFNSGTTVNINVKGKDSTFVHNNEIESAPSYGITKTTTHLLDSGTDANGNKYDAVNNVKTNITASEGGKVSFNSDVTYVGSAQDKAAGYTNKKLNISVADSASSVTFGDMVIYADTTIDNKGDKADFSAGNISVNDGATLETLGSLDLNEVALAGGTLFNQGSLSMDSLELEHASLLFAATSLTDASAAINYTGTHLTNFGANGSSVSIDDMVDNFGIVLTGSGAQELIDAGETGVAFSFTLATGDATFLSELDTVLSIEENLADFSITVNDAILRQGDGELKNLQVTVEGDALVISGTAIIPEPTTATLSLLALAALAARRRRK